MRTFFIYYGSRIPDREEAEESNETSVARVEETQNEQHRDSVGDQAFVTII